MDFFSTGGLQQLLNDLNCDDVFHCEDIKDWGSVGTDENIELSSFEDNINCTISQHEGMIENYLEQDSYDILNITSQVKVNKNDMCYENLNMQQVENSDWLENILKFHEEEFNTENLENSVPSTKMTESLITRELAEWEDKFLDNFIEIPELIDILPEKTPLCTDNCEIFLRESCKILRLDRKSQLSQLENDKSFVCTFGSCNKIYAKPAHLKAHLRRHLGEKPYICTWPECTWKFSRSDELARHRRSHSGVKPYKCDYCSKCFARSDHLTKHRKVHERRLLAASAAGIAGIMPPNVFNVRPGRRRKNTIC